MKRHFTPSGLPFTPAKRDARRARVRSVMTKKIKMHDGIIGALLLARLVDLHFIGLTALTAVIMISSAFTGFCPVHYLVSKIVRD